MYVHAYYSTNAWREIYADEIMPVPNPSHWHIPIEIESRVVGTPVNPKQAGRPKTTRSPSGFPMKEGQGKEVASKEFGSKEVPSKEVPNKECSGQEATINEGEPIREGRKCGRCHKTGHYSSTCSARIQVTRVLEVDIMKTPLKRKRNPKRCSLCGFAGHTRPTCKDPARFQ